jgi:hypothetical protein
MRRWVNPSQPDLLQIAVFLGYFRGIFTLLFGLDDQFMTFPLSDISRSGHVTNAVLRFGLPVLLAGGAYLLANGRRVGWRLLLAGAVLPLVGRLLLAFGIYLGSTPDFGSISPLKYDQLGLLFEVALVALLVHPRSRQYEKVWLE